MLSPLLESGRGKCPFSPREPFTARLTGGSAHNVLCVHPHTHTHISGVLNHLPPCCGDTNVLQRTVPPLSPLSCAVCGPPRRFHALTSAAATHDITDILQTESPLLNQLQAVRFNVFRDDSCVCVDRSRTKTLTQTHEMLLEVCRNLRRVFIWMILKNC